MDNFEYTRHPVYLSSHAVAVVTVYKTKDNLADLWTWDYIDAIKESKEAAKQFLTPIADEACMNFLWDLKEEIDRMIDDHNQIGGNFPYNRPKE